MPFQSATKTFDDVPARPAFIVDGRENMQHPVMKLDHRIPWNVLKRALNQVLAGTVSADLVNALLTLSPSQTGDLCRAFKTAAKEARAGRQPPQHQVTALEAVEREIFSLPCNLALGLNNRADDPGGDNMDFTPADVDWQGNRTVGLAGQRQRLMEKLMGSLCATTIDVAVISTTCTELCTLIGRDRLKFATAAEISHWHPGPPAQAAQGAPGNLPRTQPPYRYWLKSDGSAMTVLEIRALTTAVTQRALTISGR